MLSVTRVGKFKCMLARVAIVLSIFRIESALYLLSFTRMNEVLKANNNTARNRLLSGCFCAKGKEIRFTIELRYFPWLIRVLVVWLVIMWIPVTTLNEWRL